MVVDHGLSVTHIVKDMNTSRTAINRWIKQYRAEQQGKSRIGKLLTAELQRIRQLEQESPQLRSGKDLIKHPAASYGVLTTLFNPLAFNQPHSKEREIEPVEI